MLLNEVALGRMCELKVDLFVTCRFLRTVLNVGTCRMTCTWRNLNQELTQLKHWAPPLLTQSRIFIGMPSRDTLVRSKGVT